MGYKVIISDKAELQLDQFIYYILVELGNEQAAQNVLADAEETKERLANVADSLKLCDNSRLRSLGYRTIRFEHHRYFMVYRIDGNIVYVEGIYHELQDYENYIR
ncbi:MAG: type II toxin-antitoxin system RelE/ParE family toxin [Lachnospiraceae bacterium]|nr:type II toxin-antitoxin system RelE/ParE family toxin [Lachnospiraceae bacterium]